MSTWLMIGSSPSVLQTLPQFDDFAGTVITCNAGIKLWPDPHYFAAIDQLATLQWHDLALAAQKRGTKLITLKRGTRATKDRKIGHYDIHIQEGRGVEPTQSSWGCFRYTGPLCVEFACRYGAEAIHLIGMDGYRSGNDYFDPETERRHIKAPESSHNINHLQPRLQNLTSTWPDVQFIQHGNPCYTVSAPNWEIREPAWSQ